MIIDVEKYVIFGSKDELDPFLQKAQEKGFIEFIGSSRKKELSEPIQNILSAIKILKKRPLLDAKEDPQILPSSIAERVIHASSSLEALYEKKRITKAEIARISIFEDFNLDDVDYIENEAKRLLQFFSLKSSKKKDLTLPEELIYIGTEYDLDYFVAVNKEKQTYKGLIEILIEKPVGILKGHLSSIEQEIKKFEQDLKEYSAYFDFLQKGLIRHMNEYQLACSKKEATLHLNDNFFAFQAWIPVNKIELLKTTIGSLAIEFEHVDVESKDRVPTYMENTGYGKIGEDLVNIYDVPNPKDKDPSRWVMWAFALFFGMIVADAGYGMLYLCLALFIKFKFPNLKDSAQRLLKLLFVLALFCVGWGILTVSFFGMEVGPNNPVRKVSLIHYLAKKKAEYHLEQKDTVYKEYKERYPKLANVQNGHEFLITAAKEKEGKMEYEALKEFYDAILMEISLLVGVIHITLSFFRMLFRNWAGFGWIAFMIGGYLFFPSILSATSLLNFLYLIPKPLSYLWGERLLYGGLIAAPIIAIIQHRLSGLHEIMNVIQIFADVLSYLRLYALGLAGMIMANTFNQIGISLGLGIGFLVIIVGHGMNIILGIMGGVIHGLRLNFLEWYHYCFEGGGKKFNPLRLLKFK